MVPASSLSVSSCFFFFQAEDGIRVLTVTGVQTCALPISEGPAPCPPPHPREARLPRAEPDAAPVAEEVRARRQGRQARARGLRRGDPRLQASLPALPDPARLRRAPLRRAPARPARRHPPAGPGGGG